jgi:hypothetical protein
LPAYTTKLYEFKNNPSQIKKKNLACQLLYIAWFDDNRLMLQGLNKGILSAGGKLQNTGHAQ